MEKTGFSSAAALLLWHRNKMRWHSGRAAEGIELPQFESSYTVPILLGKDSIEI